jgi:hypothetical protein
MGQGSKPRLVVPITSLDESQGMFFIIEIKIVKNLKDFLGFYF